MSVVTTEHRAKAWKAYTRTEPVEGQGLEWVQLGSHVYIVDVSDKEKELLDTLAEAFAEQELYVKRREASIFAEHLARRVGQALYCPNCGKRHIDEGLWAARLHITHLCEYCGTKFSGSSYSVGV